MRKFRNVIFDIFRARYAIWNFASMTRFFIVSFGMNATT